MDKRREERFAADQDVTIAILGERPSRQKGRIRNTSGSGLGIVVETEIPAGTAVRIELADAILLGEVMYCRPSPTGNFLGIQVEQALRGLEELSRRFRSFEDRPADSRSATR